MRSIDCWAEAVCQPTVASINNRTRALVFMVSPLRKLVFMVSPPLQWSYPESPFWLKNGTDHIPIPLFADSLKQFSDGPAPSAPISEPAPCRNCPIFRNFCNTSPPCLVPCRQIPLLE